MANTGLRFNPYTAFGGDKATPWMLGEINTSPYSTPIKTSVPNVAEEYFAPAVPSVESSIKVQQDVPPARKQPTAGDFLEWSKQYEQSMQNLDRWNKGYMGLEGSEKSQWTADNYDKLVGKGSDFADRLWRNQEFLKTFGNNMDLFYSMDYKDRDKMMEDYLAEDAVRKKYGDDSNLPAVLDLTAEGKRELLQSDYKPSGYFKQKNQEKEDKDWWDYDLGERWNAIRYNAGEYGKKGVAIGSLAGGVLGGAAGSIAGMAVDGLVGLGYGTLRGLVAPSTGAEFSKQQEKLDNEELLHKVMVADTDRKKENSLQEINDLYSQYARAYRAGQITSGDVDEMFDQLALNGKRTATDELGNTEEYDYKGSNYYSAFKDTDEFEHFGTYDKLKQIAQAEILGRKYGQGTALQALEQDMQTYVSDNQTAWDWYTNTYKNVFVGGVANLGMNVVALGALGSRLFYGEEGLKNYLEGKDASGNGESNSPFLNPQYWNKVDQYNTFDPDVIAKADENGGVSEYNNVVLPGTENDFWSWNTLNEAVRMNKFIWSDLVKNMGLGKMVKVGTKMLGGIEMAPGVLATESTIAAKAFNKAGSYGVLNAGSLGIDAAYGIQTYNEVLEQNNQRLDQMIDKDVEAELRARMEDPKTHEEFDRLVGEENLRRIKKAGERGNWIAVDEQQAWQDYMNQLEKQIRQEQEELHSGDRNQAQVDAANAYAVDASIEHLRMATTNGVFKSYLFDKGTLNAIKANNPYVATTTKDGLYALGRRATAKKALQTMGMQVWGGFQSNYFDDVTVGYAKAFGVQDYNNYLLQKYNPAAYGSVMDDYVTPFLAGMTGATDAMTEKRSFIDGAVGALGTPLSFSVNVGGSISHKDIMKQAKEASERNQEKEGIHWTEWVSHFVNNPILQAVADAKEASRQTEREIKKQNDILKENGYSFDNMVETLTAMHQKGITREGTSLLEAEDAKDREAFAVATALLGLRNSAVVSNAQAEPDKAKWSMKKKASYNVGQALNALAGGVFFAPAESSYTNAMQTLEDASMMGEARDEAQLARQQELVNTFLGLDANKNVVQSMNEEEKTAFAIERLKKNATNLLEMMSRADKLSQKFENSLQAHLHPDLQQQLMYQYALDGRWKSRLSDLEREISGEENPETFDSDIAKYGSIKGWEREYAAQEKRVDQAQEAYDKAAWAVETMKDDANMSVAENARRKALKLFQEKTAKNQLEKEQSRLKKIKDRKGTFEGVLASDNPVVSAENILRLNAEDRYRMLDDFYRNDYSEAQQEEIDKAKNLLMADGTPIHEAMEKVKDAAILTQRIEDNMEAAKKIMQNPLEANQMQQALVENRKRKIIDYFNDKIVAEAFQDFARNTESTISQENVEKKAQEYSTAVLNGMLREIEKETARERKADGVSDKTLSVMEDGIKAVLQERDRRLGDTADLDSFIRKTQKVRHTSYEEVPTFRIAEDGTSVPATILVQTTEDRELSRNDRKLLEDALDYAAERGFSLEEMPDRIGTEDFNAYVDERNHGYQLAMNPLTGQVEETQVGTPENRVNMTSPEYLKALWSDVMTAYEENKNHVEEVTADKNVGKQAESVATKPVETKGAVAKAQPAPKENQEGRPDDVKASGNLFAGFMKPANSGINGESRQAEAAAEDNDRNGRILDEGGMLNQGILGEVKSLLDEIDKMSMEDATREKIKDILASHLNSRAFKNIQELQNALLEDAIITDQAEAPQIDMKATALAHVEIGEKKDENNKDSENGGNNGKDNASTLFPPMPALLETRDLDTLMQYPAMASYIEGHHVVGFLQKLADAWNQAWEEHKSTKKQVLLLQSQVVFIYDPTLAEQTKSSMEEQGMTYTPAVSAPIIMALEITDKNKALVEDENQLLSIKDKAENKVKQYQVLGFMPSNEVSQHDSEAMRATAMRMGALRSRINFDDTDAHVLRYAPAKDTGKYNGGIIRTNIEKVSSHTEDASRPFGTQETPKKGVELLMDENMRSATETFVSASEEEKRIYNEALERGDRAGLRNTSLYKKMRKAFLDRLIKRERKSEDPDDADNKELDFKLQKGTSDTWRKIVFTKKISETVDKNTGVPIVELLRGVDAAGNNAEEVVASNSRFEGLFKRLGRLKLPKGLFTAAGVPVNQASYEKALGDLASSVENSISNFLNVDGLKVRVEISEGIPADKIVAVKIYSGDINQEGNLLSTLSTQYNGEMSKAEYASFLKDLILDAEGNARAGLKDSRFERVKWQVNYENANTLQDKSKGAEERNAARKDFENLYDDGVWEMQVTKLAYPARSVTATVNNTMKSRLYTESKAEPENQVPKATETKAAFEAETVAGKVDGDTGAITEAPSREALANGMPKLIKDTIQKILKDSKERKLTDDGRHYEIGGQIYSRVTSIKYAMDGMGERFNPNSPWAIPSSLIGNSVDEFGRDVFNGVFDSMTEEERMKAFGNYDNSTEKNYFEVYMALKAFEARLREKGQVIVSTGTQDDAGSITAKGVINVAVRGGNGVQNRQVRVAGTLDVLAVDTNGGLHIYDFKTRRNNALTQEEAMGKGYDRQLSMYAKFLEDEYGLKVKDINIIPIKAEYEAPTAQDSYKEAAPGSNQLVKTDGRGNYETFTGANYEVGKEFCLTRLSDEELLADFDKMTEVEKEALVEAIQDQSEAPAKEEVKAEDVITAKPEIEAAEEEEEENMGGRPKGGRLGRRRNAGREVSMEDSMEAINPHDKGSLKAKMEELERACGGKKG